jgi:hypothetical protein
MCVAGTENELSERRGLSECGLDGVCAMPVVEAALVILLKPVSSPVSMCHDDCSRSTGRRRPSQRFQSEPSQRVARLGPSDPPMSEWSTLRRRRASCRRPRSPVAVDPTDASRSDTVVDTGSVVRRNRPHVTARHLDRVPVERQSVWRRPVHPPPSVRQWHPRSCRGCPKLRFSALGVISAACGGAFTVLKSVSIWVMRLRRMILARSLHTVPTRQEWPLLCAREDWDPHFVLL